MAALRQTVFKQRNNNKQQNERTSEQPMGNCNKKDEALTVTNFDDEHWSMQRSTIHPLCFIMKNNYHPNVVLMKWIASTKKTNKLTKFRDEHKQEYLVNAYQSGETRKPIQAEKQKFMAISNEKRPYFVTEELIRLRDASLTEQETAAVAYKSLVAYQELMSYTGGFVAKQSMIYLNREGVPKMWINENLAQSQLEYPHPAITEEQFIASLLHQIFTLDNQKHAQSKIYNYIKSGQISFNEVIAKLNYFLQENGASLDITVSKDKFDAIINSYSAKNRNSTSSTKSRASKAVNENKKHSMSQSSSNRLKFMVADKGRDSTSYVRDYSQKRPVEPMQSPDRAARLKTQSSTPLIYYPQASLNTSYEVSRIPVNMNTSFNRAHSGLLVSDAYYL